MPEKKHSTKTEAAKPKKEKGFKKWFAIFRDTTKKWNSDDPFRQSSVVAYYAIFSLPSLLFIVIAVSGYFFNSDTISKKVIDIISTYIGTNAADQVQVMITKSAIGNKPWYGMIIGIVTTISGAIGVFGELQQSLNYIWGVEPKPGKNFLKSVRDNLFSFGLVLSIGFLLLISLVISTLLTSLGNWITAYFSTVAKVVLQGLDFIISFGIITVLFALMFKVLPDAKIKWKYIWRGAALTSVLFVIGKYGMSIYFGKFQPASAYGVAGTFVLILLWLSYSSMILFYGAEFTKQITLKSEGKIVPAESAVRTAPDPSIAPNTQKKQQA